MITTDSAGAALTQAFADAASAAFVGYDLVLLDAGTQLDCGIKRLVLSMGTAADQGGELAIGSALSDRMDATLYGLASSIVGKELEVRVGVDVGGAYTYVTVAWLTVTSAKGAGQDLTAIKASGRIASVLADMPFPTDGTLTAAQVASALTTATGVTVALGAFASTAISLDVSDGWTCRQALVALARALGGIAMETPDGGVAVQPIPTASTASVDPDAFRALPALSGEAALVDGITVTTGEDAYTFGTGAIALEVPGMSAQDAALLWANVSGRGYTPGTLTLAVVDPRITTADALLVDGAFVPCWGMSLTFDGGWWGTINAPELSGRGVVDLIGDRVDAAQAAASAAGVVAREAKSVADATNQHFFADSGGIHVTEAEGDPATGHNILINSLGILLRKALNPLVSITQSAIAFYDGAGTAAANVVASFGSSGAQIGKASANHLSIGSSGMEVLDGSTSRAFFGSTARIGATAAPHVNVNSTGMHVYANASTKTAEIAAANNVSYLRLVDNHRYVSASTSGSGTSTTDHLTLGSYGTNNGHHAGIRLIASGTNGQAVLRLHDDESGSSESVDLTPTALYIGSDIATYINGGAYITGSAEVYGSLALGTPLSAVSGGTGSTAYGTVVDEDVSTSVSLANASWTSICSINIAAGYWLIHYNMNFVRNATGRRVMALNTNQNAQPSAANFRLSGVSSNAVSGGAMTQLNGCVIMHPTSTTTYYLTVYQNSGSALGATCHVQAFRLK